MAHPIEFLENRIAPATIIAATGNNELLQFDSETPADITTITISGLLGTTGETLVGIDFRPATGHLYGFTVNSASQGQLYRIDQITGEATAVGTAITDAGLTLSTTAGYGFDFNPTVDRIRIVNSDGENFRVNPNNGVLAGVDTDLTAGSVVQGSAYDRSFAGSTSTTLFGIDVNTDQLVLQGSVNGTPSSPNGGVITNVGALGVNAVSASFDIANGTGLGFAALQVGSSTGLYTINLTTGAATVVADIGTGTSTIVGLAVATEQIQIVNSKTAKYTDVDGDVVTIKITKGELTPGLFELAAGPNGGAYLRSLNLTDTAFAGTNLTITAKASKDAGNKLAGIGYINATGNDLGAVNISGDLTQIDAGDNQGGNAMKSLSIYSFGAINPALTAGDLSATDLISTIEGSLPKLSVKQDFRNAQLLVTDSTEGGIGTLKSVVIGGSFVGGSTPNFGSIQAEDIGTVKITGDLLGGAGNGSGTIFGDAGIDSITIGGSFIGGTDENAGGISSEGEIGSVTVKGSIIGGNDLNTANISANKINKVTVNGSVIGISQNTGNISAATIGSVNIKGDLEGFGLGSALINGGAIGTVKIGGSMSGFNEDSGSILADSALEKVEIGGNVVGSGSGSGSGLIEVDEGSLGTVLIKGSVQGGAIFGSGGIERVTVNGDVSSSSNESAIASNGAIGSVTIKGSLSSSNGTGNIIGATIDSVTIQRDVLGAFIAANEGGIGSIKVRGSLEYSSIFSNATIGNISVDGDVVSTFEGGSIRALGEIDTITIKGSILSGNSGASISAGVLNSLKVNGDIAGSAVNPILISALGTGATTGDADIAIGTITVGGQVENATIRAGYNPANSNPENADAQIGKVSVGGDWIRSNLVAGIVSEDAVFGNADDSIIGEVGSAPTIIASIASITIKGSLIGTFGGTDGYAFTAEEVKAVTIAGKKVLLNEGPSNDDLIPSGVAPDIRIRELEIV